MLGVSSQHTGTDAVARAERATVMVLHPVDAAAVHLAEDGLEIRAGSDRS